MAHKHDPKAGFPSVLMKIRLELAREPGHPDGNHNFGYVMLAPLNRRGELDAAAWRANRERCRVVRFRPDGEEEAGVLAHCPGDVWRFRYKGDDNLEEESGFRLGSERFVLGEYISVASPDGMHTYRVVSVGPA